MRLYLVDVRRREGAHKRLFGASLQRAHDIAGDPEDAVLLAEQVQRLDGLFRKTTIRLGGNIIRPA
jgi:hypothetical protein